MCQKLFSSAALLVLAVLFISVSGVAQTPSNVETASRYRATNEAASLNTSSATEVKLNAASEINIRVFENNSSSQLSELGSRYGWSTSNSQLSELGSRYGWSTSRAQI